MSNQVSSYLSSIDNLPDVHQRLQTVQIEHLDFRECIKRYDTPETLFYLDPPYALDTRTGGKSYQCELSDSDHSDLANQIMQLAGMCVLSGYDTPIYQPLINAGWARFDFEQSSTARVGLKNQLRRTESLWLCPKTQAREPMWPDVKWFSPACHGATGQASLF